MAKILSFNDFKNKQSQPEVNDRLSAIKGSLDRINSLMSDLKQMANKPQESFQDVIAKNKENEERVAKERKKANNQLKHNLKLDWKNKK